MIPCLISCLRPLAARGPATFQAVVIPSRADDEEPPECPVRIPYLRGLSHSLGMTSSKKTPDTQALLRTWEKWKPNMLAASICRCWPEY
jgi:hypothetical protein